MLLIAAAAVAAQALVLVTLPDDTILGVAAYGAEKQGISREVIDERIAANRGQILSGVRKEMQTPLIMKTLILILFVAIALGLRRGRRRPTRLLAGIAGVIGALVVVVAATGGGLATELDAAKVAGTHVYLIDLAWFVLLGLSTVLCFVVVRGATWQVPASAPAAPAA